MQFGVYLGFRVRCSWGSVCGTVGCGWGHFAVRGHVCVYVFKVSWPESARGQMQLEFRLWWGRVQFGVGGEGSGAVWGWGSRGRVGVFSVI